MYGPPGTGKTLLARAVAHHTECTFIRVSGSELVQKFIGEGSRMVRELFVMARSVASLIAIPYSLSSSVHKCLLVFSVTLKYDVWKLNLKLEIEIETSHDPSEIWFG